MQSLLEQSITLYQNLRDGIEKQAASLAAEDAGEIETFTAWLASAMHPIRATDCLLQEQLQRNHTSAEQQLLEHRLDLMLAAQSALDRLTPSIQAAMALHKTELDKIRGGMQIAGYANPLNRTGSRISGKH